MIHFIGIGAQRTGTSWTYACLYEHPEICAPIKEIHFFSRPRYAEGLAWYEAHFKKCKEGQRVGEFSTSYLYSEEASARIHSAYPEAKIIAILRDPIERARSQYGNAVKGGAVPESMSFEEYYTTDESVLAQGLYAQQLARYFTHFKREQVLVLIHEDAKKDPKEYIQSIYRFLGVDDTFIPSMLHETINNTRVPKNIALERRMHLFSEFLRRNGLDAFVHAVRRSGLPEMVRKVNTKPKNSQRETFDRSTFVPHFKDDVAELSRMLGRDLSTEWGIM
jgi:hypothetical protein